MMPPIKELSKEQEQRIVSLYESGLSLNAIYEVYGFSHSVAKRTLMKYGVEMRKSARQIAWENAGKKKEKPKEIVIGEPIDCDTQGKRCIYRETHSKQFACNYCSFTGKLRGGSPNECTKYKFRQKRGVKSDKQ